jgi:hypothetical protein
MSKTADREHDVLSGWGVASDEAFEADGSRKVKR